MVFPLADKKDIGCFAIVERQDMGEIACFRQEAEPEFQRDRPVWKRRFLLFVPDSGADDDPLFMKVDAILIRQPRHFVFGEKVEGPESRRQAARMMSRMAIQTAPNSRRLSGFNWRICL